MGTTSLPREWPDVKFLVFLSKDQFKLSKGAEIIMGTAVTVSQITIENPRNVYKIKPGEAVYTLLLEQLTPVLKN